VKLDLETTSTPHGQRENWVASICMWCKSDLKFLLAPHGNKKIGFHPFVCGVQVKPENYMNTPWQ